MKQDETTRYKKISIFGTQWNGMKQDETLASNKHSIFGTQWNGMKQDETLASNKHRKSPQVSIFLKIPGVK